MKKGLLFTSENQTVPKWIVLQLLEACNLRCKMCYEWGESGAYINKKELNVLDLDVIKNIIDKCSPAQPYYELFGGEPLLYPHIFEVIKDINEHGSKVDIATNGTLLEKHAEKLVESGITRIWVSLDGLEEVNDAQRGIGTYQKAITGIKKILELRKGDTPKIGITTIVTPENAHALEDFFMKFTQECDIDHASFEFQNYATNERYVKYQDFLKNNFDIDDTSSAFGLVRDIKDFSNIDINLLTQQMHNLKDYCKGKGIKFFHNPSTIDFENYKNYFSADWDKMADKKVRCPFVWIHAEIAASGEVIICHTLQDLSFGNVNDTDFLDIWNSEKSQKYRKLLRKGMMPMCIACSRYYTQTAGHNS